MTFFRTSLLAAALLTAGCGVESEFDIANAEVQSEVESARTFSTGVYVTSRFQCNQWHAELDSLEQQNKQLANQWDAAGCSQSTTLSPECMNLYQQQLSVYSKVMALIAKIQQYC